MDIDLLIKEFNALVGKRCWTSARAAHDASLIKSLINKGIDISAIYNGHSISFSHEIALNEERNCIILSNKL